MPKLTKRFVDTLRAAPKGDRFVWDSGDGALKGFGIRIKPSGAAAFIIQYRNAEARTRRMVVGKVGVLTPDAAREEARGKLATVSKGSDPSAERHAARHAMTVTELCDLYLKEAADHLKATTLESDKGRIECHIKPLLGKRVANGLNLADIERFQADVAAGKTAKLRKATGRGGHAKGGRSAAARTLGTLSAIMSFAQRRKIIGENPVRGVGKFKDKKNKRFLSPAEIAALGKAISDSPVEPKTAKAAITALLLTGCRRNEILSLPWAWLDANANCIRFEDTKSGAQIRPIGTAAAEHLASQKKHHRDDGEQVRWIFPAERGEGHFIGIRRVFLRLCKQAKIENATIHALRHTFAATAASLGYSELTIAGLLGHTVPGITARYAHVPDSALISAANRVSATIAAALTGGKYGAEVLVLRKQKRRTK